MSPPKDDLFAAQNIENVMDAARVADAEFFDDERVQRLVALFMSRSHYRSMRIELPLDGHHHELQSLQLFSEIIQIPNSTRNAIVFTIKPRLTSAS